MRLPAAFRFSRLKFFRVVVLAVSEKRKTPQAKRLRGMQPKHNQNLRLLILMAGPMVLLM